MTQPIACLFEIGLVEIGLVEIGLPGIGLGQIGSTGNEQCGLSKLVLSFIYIHRGLSPFSQAPLRAVP